MSSFSNISQSTTLPISPISLTSTNSINFNNVETKERQIAAQFMIKNIIYDYIYYQLVMQPDNTECRIRDWKSPDIWNLKSIDDPDKVVTEIIHQHTSFPNKNMLGKILNNSLVTRETIMHPPLPIQKDISHICGIIIKELAGEHSKIESTEIEITENILSLATLIKKSPHHVFVFIYLFVWNCILTISDIKLVHVEIDIDDILEDNNITFSQKSIMYMDAISGYINSFQKDNIAIIVNKIGAHYDNMVKDDELKYPPLFMSDNEVGALNILFKNLRKNTIAGIQMDLSTFKDEFYSILKNNFMIDIVKEGIAYALNRGTNVLGNLYDHCKLKKNIIKLKANHLPLSCPGNPSSQYFLQKIDSSKFINYYNDYITSDIHSQIMQLKSVADLNQLKLNFKLNLAIDIYVNYCTEYYSFINNINSK